MDKRSKTYREYLRALKVAETALDPQGMGMCTSKETISALLLGVSALLNPPKTGAPRYDPKAVDFLDTLLRVAGESIQATPFDANWYQLMTWKFRDMPDLTIDDAVFVGEYIADGGWRGGVPTVKQVISYLAELLAGAEKGDDYDPRYIR